MRNADLDFLKTRQIVAVFTKMSCLGFIDDIHLMLIEVIMFDDFVSYTHHYIYLKPYTELIRTDTYSEERNAHLET